MARRAERGGHGTVQPIDEIPIEIHVVLLHVSLLRHRLHGLVLQAVQAFGSFLRISGVGSQCVIAGKLSAAKNKIMSCIGGWNDKWMLWSLP